MIAEKFPDEFYIAYLKKLYVEGRADYIEYNTMPGLHPLVVEGENIVDMEYRGPVPKCFVSGLLALGVWRGGRNRILDVIERVRRKNDEAYHAERERRIKALRDMNESYGEYKGTTEERRG